MNVVEKLREGLVTLMIKMDALEKKVACLEASEASEAPEGYEMAWELLSRQQIVTESVSCVQCPAQKGLRWSMLRVQDILSFEICDAWDLCRKRNSPLTLERTVHVIILLTRTVFVSMPTQFPFPVRRPNTSS